MGLGPGSPRRDTRIRPQVRLEVFRQKELRRVDPERPRLGMVRLAAVHPVVVRPAGTTRGLGSGRKAGPAHLLDRHSLAQFGTIEVRV
jgi:hypothetical protein